LNCPPPRNFRQLLCPPASARLSLRAPVFSGKVKRSAAQSRGIRYEKKVQKYLLEQFEDFYLPSPWLHFREEGQEDFRWAQPDGLLIDGIKGIINIVEIKYSHTADAWWQVRRLYLPVLQKLFPPTLWRYEALEVVKWYDSDTIFPEKVQLVDNPMRSSSHFKVHIFNN